MDRNNMNGSQLNPEETSQSGPNSYQSTGGFGAQNSSFNQSSVRGFNYNPPPPVFEPKYYEKKAIKRTANHIGFGILFFYIVVYLLQIFLVSVLTVAGKSNFLEDSVFLLSINTVLTIVGFLGAAAIIIKSEKGTVTVPLSAPKKGKTLPLVMTGIGFCYVANVSVMLIQNSLSSFGELKSNNIDLPSGGMGFVFSIITVAVFPALIEEFLFRGAIMGSLSKFGKPFAIFTSAVLFGLIHGNLVQIPFAFLVGLVLGFAVYESGSLWVSILIHLLNNLVSVLLDYFEVYLGTVRANAVFMVLLLLMIFVGFFGIYLLCRDNEKVFEFTKTAHISTSKDRFWWTIGSGAVIASLLFIVLEVVANQTLS